MPSRARRAHPPSRPRGRSRAGCARTRKCSRSLAGAPRCRGPRRRSRIHPRRDLARPQGRCWPAARSYRRGRDRPARLSRPQGRSALRRRAAPRPRSSRAPAARWKHALLCCGRRATGQSICGPFSSSVARIVSGRCAIRVVTHARKSASPRGEPMIDTRPRAAVQLVGVGFVQETAPRHERDQRRGVHERVLVEHDPVGLGERSGLARRVGHQDEIRPYLRAAIAGECAARARFEIRDRQLGAEGASRSTLRTNAFAPASTTWSVDPWPTNANAPARPSRVENAIPRARGAPAPCARGIVAITDSDAVSTTLTDLPAEPTTQTSPARAALRRRKRS